MSSKSSFESSIFDFIPMSFADFVKIGQLTGFRIILNEDSEADFLLYGNIKGSEFIEDSDRFRNDVVDDLRINIDRKLSIASKLALMNDYLFKLNPLTSNRDARIIQPIKKQLVKQNLDKQPEDIVKYPVIQDFLHFVSELATVCSSYLNLQKENFQLISNQDITDILLTENKPNESILQDTIRFFRYCVHDKGIPFIKQEFLAKTFTLPNETDASKVRYELKEDHDNALIQIPINFEKFFKRILRYQIGLSEDLIQEHVNYYQKKNLPTAVSILESVLNEIEQLISVSAKIKIVKDNPLLVEALKRLRQNLLDKYSKSLLKNYSQLVSSDNQADAPNVFSDTEPPQLIWEGSKDLAISQIKSLYQKLTSDPNPYVNKTITSESDFLSLFYMDYSKIPPYKIAWNIPYKRGPHKALINYFFLALKDEGFIDYVHFVNRADRLKHFFANHSGHPIENWHQSTEPAKASTPAAKAMLTLIKSIRQS